MKRNGRTCSQSSMPKPTMPKPTMGRCTNSCWCRGRCRSKRIREQMGHQRLRLLDGPSDRKDPDVCSEQTLGKWFPHTTSSGVHPMRGRTAQSSPKIVCFDLIAHLLHTLVMKGLVKQQVCLCNHGKDVWQVIH